MSGIGSTESSASRLPEAVTAFIGREAEVAALLRMLDQPECRLITIVAPGGSGKTRLAVEVAARWAEASGLPARFVNLEPQGDAHAASLAIAEAFGLAMPSMAGDWFGTLIGVMREQAALLVLDNFEHLAETCADAVGRLAASCPELRLLVTSRVALNIRQEWRFSLEGLQVADGGSNSSEGDAVRLFLERARQVSGRSDESFDIGVVRGICEAVDGMPLAIEMAAAWSRSLSDEEIAREIEGRLDILTATMRDLPGRQRSITAVFDQSLALLDEQHRAVFRKLGVFGSSFGRGAAVEIAGASLPVLATLVDHSLTWARPGGRYRLHSLLRNYAREALEAEGTLDELEARHSRYYLAFAARRSAGIVGREQLEAITEMNLEYENLAQAWRYGCAQGLVEEVANAAVAYAAFLDITARYQEELATNEDLIALARRHGGGRADILTNAHALRAGTHIRLGNLDAAEADCHAARALRERSGVTSPRSVATNDLAMLGLVELVRGNYGEAKRWSAIAEEATGAGDPMGTALACYVAAGAEYGQGAYREAAKCAERGLDLTQDVGDRWFCGYIHIQLAECELAQGRLENAARHAEQARESRALFDDRQGIALATLRLGDVAYRQQDFSLARQHYLQALRLYRDTADRGGKATVLASLAQVDAAEGDAFSARTRFRQALEEAEAIGYAAALAQVFLGVARMQLGAGDRTGATLLLAYLIHSTSTPRVVVDEARRLLDGAGLPTAARREAERQAAGLALADVCAALTKTLASPKAEMPDAAPRSAALQPPELTRREVQVLALLDRGATNSAVARELGLTTNTVKWYCTQIFGKLDAPNRTAALARARELGLLA